MRGAIENGTVNREIEERDRMGGSQGCRRTEASCGRKGVVDGLGDGGGRKRKE